MKSCLKRLIAAVLLMGLIMAIVVLPVTVVALEESGHNDMFGMPCPSTATVRMGPYLAIDKSRPCTQHQFCTVFTKQYYWDVRCQKCTVLLYSDYGPITTTHLATQSP